MRRFKKEKDSKLWQAVRMFLRGCELYSPAYNEPEWVHVDGSAHMFVATNDVQITVYWFKETSGDIRIANVAIKHGEED